MDIKNSNIAKFLVVGATACISSAANAINTVGMMASHMAMRGTVHSSSAQKAVQVVTDPANMTWIQRNPGLFLAGAAATVGLILGGMMAYAGHQLLTARDRPLDDEEQKSPSITERISALREKFMPSSSTNPSLKI